VADFDITIEGLSDEVIAAYGEAELQRGSNGSSTIEWTFRNNPAPFAVARSNGKIVGISSYIQSSMKFANGVGTSLQAVDSFVMPQARRKGLFSKLAVAYRDHAERSDCDLVWGFPNENAAPVWFNRLGWTSFGQVPFLVKPLRAGYFLRKMGIERDFKISRERDNSALCITSAGEWIDSVWERFSADIPVSRLRDREFISYRLFDSPDADSYRVAASPDATDGALVATRQMEKHGGRIAYIMEAYGGRDLRGLISSELGRLTDQGTELVLAWSYPWSPNYSTLRKCGFLPLPERLRPISIWAGALPISPKGAAAYTKSNWYLSYLDSDTV
tara:strand:- start:9401 stop:10393 length:993 start_codon:yes stop_codon:yes gene_type:complete